MRILRANKSLLLLLWTVQGVDSINSIASRVASRGLEDQQRDDDSYNDRSAHVMCSELILQFVEGATNSRDVCEGIQNSINSLECEAFAMGEMVWNDQDDYFRQGQSLTETCCPRISLYQSEYCQSSGLFNSFHIALAVALLLLCEIIKMICSRFPWIPGPTIGIVVGVVVGLVGTTITEGKVDNFDTRMFFGLLLPPIMLDAALSVSKTEFKHQLTVILLFSVLGTIISTITTGLLLYLGLRIPGTETFPLLDSMVFGSLIAAVDPVAFLRVLTNLGLDPRNSLLVLVLGESLLNDAVSSTIFRALVSRFTSSHQGDHFVEQGLEIAADFFVILLGSLAVGLGIGAAAWSYFAVMGRQSSDVLQVTSFFLWAALPYYICDSVGWSGIVGVVVMGFVLDLRVAVRHGATEESLSTLTEAGVEVPNGTNTCMSVPASRSVRFISKSAAQLAETAIFVYLGFFLFSEYYYWSFKFISMAIISTVASRVFMVGVVSWLVQHVHHYQVLPRTEDRSGGFDDRRTQVILVVAGLQGAVSLALIESIPLHNAATGDGCEYKKVLKAMTSACIVFSTLVFGCGAYGLVPRLGVLDGKQRRETLLEGV